MKKYLKQRLYKAIKKYRMARVSRLLDPAAQTVLDIGCQDLILYNRIKDRYRVTLADIEPKDPLMVKEDVQRLSFTNRSFDIVLCQEVLEHVPDPVKAIAELKRVAAKQLIITVPYEPFFSFYRLSWEKEHLWAITPAVLRTHLGKPSLEAKLFLKRYYLGVWTFG